MARLQELIKLKVTNINLVFVHINEAHSVKWPLGLTDHPQVHSSIEDRIERAQKFVIDYDFPYTVYIDTWTDDFEKSYQAWPDKYYIIENGTIQEHSQYSEDALVTNDYVKMLKLNGF